MNNRKEYFIKFIKKFYLEILIIINGIILLFLVEDRFAISKQIKVIAKNAKVKEKINNNLDTDVFICTNEKPILEIVEETYKKSKIFSFKEYKKEFYKINKENIKHNTCILNSSLKIPEYNSEQIRNKPLNWNQPVYGIYIRWDLANSENIIYFLEKIKNTKINSFVIDAKDIVGILTYKSNDPIVQKYQKHPAIIKDFPKLVDFLHKNNIYLIVRLATFQDMNLIQYRKDLAIYNPNTLSKTIEFKGQPIWLDPAKEEVQDYNLRIFKELISFGVDEIQFDYIRYPAEGNLKNVQYHNVFKPEDKIKHLKNFLFKAWMIQYPTNTKLSIDTFGITGWQEKKDIEATGQNIPEISLFINVISPMLYPSHFGKIFENIKNPADYPEYFYSKGIQLFRDLVPEYVQIRPWIQAFSWRVTSYNEEYIKRQIKTIEENKGFGWLMWNAANEYKVPLRAVQIKK